MTLNLAFSLAGRWAIKPLMLPLLRFASNGNVNTWSYTAESIDYACRINRVVRGKGGFSSIKPVHAALFIFTLRFQQSGTESEMLRKRIKIPVAVEQGEATFDAAGGNYRIDGLANGDPSLSQDTEIPR